TVTPGPPSFVIFTPSSIRLFGAGDSATFQVRVADRYLNPITDVVPVLQVSDTTLLSLTSPTTPGGTGTVRALTGGARALIAATLAVAQPLALGVEVYPNPRNVCAGIATPQDVSGGPITVTDSLVCLAPNANVGEYA